MSINIKRIAGFTLAAVLFSALPTITALAQNKGVITGDRVNIRTAASLDSSVITRLDTGHTVEVVSKEGDFYRLTGDYDGAYVSTQYLDIVRAEGILADENVSILKSPSDSSDILGQGSIGEPIEIIGSDGSWYIINYNDQNAFVSKELVIGHKLADYISSKSPSKAVETQQWTSSGSADAQDIINYAKQYLGTPYVYAGTSLTKGVDCSGFVYTVMKDFGITLNRSSSAQSKNGYSISKSELKMGDLVFFDTNGGANRGNISHVGIYIGDGEFIHSSSSKKTWGITISSIYEDYYSRNYVSARRVLD